MDGVFITGTDTGVGKTVISAGIMKILHGAKKACYWKPVQTGTIVGDDTSDVKKFTELDDSYFIEPGYRFPEPVSPHMAAKKWGKSVDLDVLTNTFQEQKRAGKFMVIEGAGGLLVPLNETQLQLDLIKRLGLPIIIVAEDRVGAINQSLLTLNAAREAGVVIVGVILTKCRKTLGNADSITHFGNVEILAELDPTEDYRNTVAQVGGNKRLRQLFQVPVLPD